MSFNKNSENDNFNKNLSDDIININNKSEEQNFDDLLNLYGNDISSLDEDEDVINIIKEAKKVNDTDSLRIKDIGPSNNSSFDEDDIDNDGSEFIDLASNVDKNDYDENDLSNSNNKKGLFQNKKKNNKKNKIVDKERKKIKKQQKKDNNVVINIDDGSTYSETEDFVIIQDQKKRFNGLKAFIKFIIAVIIFIILTVAVYICLSFKFVPENVKGSDYSVNGYSMISSSYKPNLDELRKNDKVICVNNKSAFIPIIFDYNVYTCISRNSYMITCEKSNGEKIKIEANNIDYIIKQ